MNLQEIDAFVLKFKNLWQAGHNAHLDIDTQAGQAWVSLRLELGEHPGPLKNVFTFPPPNSSRNSP